MSPHLGNPWIRFVTCPEVLTSMLLGELGLVSKAVMQYYANCICCIRSASQCRRVGITLNFSTTQEQLSLRSFIFRSVDFSIADSLSFALKDSFLLIRTFVLLGVYTVTCFTHRDMKFLTLRNHSFKFLFSFQSNYKSLLPVSNTMSPSQVNCYVKHFYGLADNLFCNWHAAKEPDLGHFKT